MKGIKITEGGAVQLAELPKRDYLFESMRETIDCRIVEIVGLGYSALGEKYCMVIDEEGLLKDKPVINHIASYLYGIHKHGTPICGNVLIMKNHFTDEGIDTTGLDEEDIAFVVEEIRKIVLPATMATIKFLEKRGLL